MPTNQRFQITLAGRKSSEDPLTLARRIFFDMKGCEVSAASECSAGLRLTLGIIGDAEAMEPKHIEMFAGILTDRHSYRIQFVQPLFTGNLSKTVDRILAKKS